MRRPFKSGRVFFGVSIAVLGILTVVDGSFPYMLLPPHDSWRPDGVIVPYIFGPLLIAAGVCITSNKQLEISSLALGGLLTFVFVFLYLPYQFIETDFMTLHSWETAEKELDLACGAFIAAGIFYDKLYSTARMLFAITIVTYGIFHFQLAEGVADYVPSWIPFRLFWAYAGGVGLIACGLAILFNRKIKLAGMLLGVMILSWFLILHVPRVIMAPMAEVSSETASACLALAYSGIAFMIHQKSRTTS